jgi:S-DNA-T family DNA segregation ATPase FtsK/SpoIIIE
MVMAGTIKDKFIGMLSVVLGLFLGISCYSYDKWDPSLFTYTAHDSNNFGGTIGAYLADIFLTFIGLSSFAIPVLLVLYGIKRMMGMPRHRVHLAGAVLLVLSSAVLLSMMDLSFKLEHGAGGMIGAYIGKTMLLLIPLAGVYVIVLSLVFTSLILLSPFALLKLIMTPRKKKVRVKAEEPLNMGAPLDISEPTENMEDVHEVLDIEEISGDTEPRDEDVSDEVLDELFNVDEIDEDIEAVEVAEVTEIADETPSIVDHIAEAPSSIDIVPDEPEPDETAKDLSPSRLKRGYQIPSLELLHIYNPLERPSRESLLASASLLEAKLGEFSVKGKVTQVHAGPVVTMNEFKPSAGVKINRVVNLAEDLALTLRAPSVRIAPVPGKSKIGIEVPNLNREIVSLRDVLASESFLDSQSKITIAFGKDIFGTPVIGDLARMPHLLVAGATGSGKSVFMNAMITSLLYKAKPSEVKMLMIDPKLLELSVYDGIPHLIAPVITNPKDASEMLRRMVFEMERRYRLLADQSVRNIEGFNEVVSEKDKLPYIVVFIDELADLMLSSAAKVEESIARLAQMARASGIHLVLATQRPSVDVITGVIKANFPARVAFQVTSKVDSRTIIDTQGAEQLIGRGDMLFMLPGVKLLRVHGALVTEAEVKGIVEFVSSQGEPDYRIIQDIVEAQETAKADAEYSEDRDDMFWRAVEVAESNGEVSISSIQRRLKIGYNRAARIMEIMEGDGMVGPPKGAGKPRDFHGRQN